MFKSLLLLLLLPVLYEGRIRPAQTVPESDGIVIEQYQELAGTTMVEATGKALLYPSMTKLRAELFLYQFPFKWLIIGSYLLAILFRKKWLLWGGLLLHTLALALHSYILGRPPVSNMSETILYVPWICVCVGLLFKRPFLAASGAVILLLFLPTHETLTTVPPVLDSNYWLMTHVLMVVGSYGILLFSGICGHILPFKPSEKLERILINSLYLGAGLLICGTILGGIWAAQSWGRFWDWDPKEAWAFISAGCYLIIIHAYRFKKIASRGLAIGSIIGLMAITFTWYGVNYILSAGLHSYGFGNGGELYYYAYLILEILFILMIFFTKNRRLQKKTPY